MIFQNASIVANASLTYRVVFVKKEEKEDFSQKRGGKEDLYKKKEEKEDEWDASIRVRDFPTVWNTTDKKRTLVS